MTHRCIKPACEKLACVGCNCAVPEAVYEAIRAACRAEALEEAAKLCDTIEGGRYPDGQVCAGFACECSAAIREMK